MPRGPKLGGSGAKGGRSPGAGGRGAGSGASLVGRGGRRGIREAGCVDVGSTTALLAAVVGVVGTLLSALLTQRAADRSRQREQERAEQARERRGEAQELRSCYVALNTATRQYLAALTDQLHALDRGEDPRSVRQRLTEARDQHRDVYAEAQLRVPERVLALAGDLSRELGAVYGMVRRLDDGAPRDTDSAAGAQERIDALWRQLRQVRGEMRADVGAGRDGHRAPGGDSAAARLRTSGGAPQALSGGSPGPAPARGRGGTGE